MDTTKKIALLNRLLNQSERIKIRDSGDPTFKTWKNTVKRTLTSVFGAHSQEFKQFSELIFFYRAIVMTLGNDYSRQDRQAFERDFEIAISSIRNYIEELELADDEDAGTRKEGGVVAGPKVFISHSSDDKDIVEELVDLLEIMGVPDQSIFCTSVPGHGIGLGENFLDRIKKELNNDTLVLFVLSRSWPAPVF